jgi:hypothetical protein
MVGDVKKPDHAAAFTRFPTALQRRAGMPRNTPHVRAKEIANMQIMRSVAVAGLCLALAPQVMAEQAMPKMTYKSTETPSYRVEASKDELEIRIYAPRIVAEVTVGGSRTEAINAGFRVLAGYIFGGNEARAKVAMTSPVAQAASEKIAMTSPVAQTGADGQWVVQFTMPQSYRMDTLPKPKDPRIRLIEQPGDREVVVQFSGLAGADVLATQEARLRELAKKQGLSLGAGPFYYFYDSPFTLPWNRRNEVAFRIK